MSEAKVGDIFFLYDPAWYNIIARTIRVCSTDRLRWPGRIPHHMGIVTSCYGKGVEVNWLKGVRFIDIDRYVYHKSIHIWFKRLRPELWPSGDEMLGREMLRNWLVKQIGRRYDKTQIVGIFLRSFTRVVSPLYRFLKKRKHPFLDQRFEFTCSEMVKVAYKEVLNIDLYPSASSSNITPYDLDRSPLLETV